MSLLDWLFESGDDDDAGPDDCGEWGIYDDCPENYPADNDFADD